MQEGGLRNSGNKPIGTRKKVSLDGDSVSLFYSVRLRCMKYKASKVRRTHKQTNVWGSSLCVWADGPG
jgi:hypothetical protein